MRLIPFLLGCPLVAQAVPVEVLHQGRVLGPAGAVVEGPTSLRVSLHNAETAGTELWADTFSITVDDGYFSVLLGSGAPLDTVTHLGAAEVWVATSVGGVATGPRMPLVRVPYAARADGLSAGATVGGALMLGDEASNWCVAGREGGLVYDRNLKRVKVCRGSDGWQVIGTIQIVSFGSYRAWDDGTFARACWEYRSPTSGLYLYGGVTGDGVYRVDPDGAGSGVAPFDVYCDMTFQGGGWTLVDNDATNAATFTSRTVGAITDPGTTGGRRLPGYSWSADPLLMCKSSYFTGSAGWLTLEAGGAIAREYPTVVTQSNSHAAGWAARTLNGNTNQGMNSWIFNGSGRFGSVWIGNGSTNTCACDYTGDSSGLGNYTSATTTTCSTWVR
jgi:hypothetical protein